MRATYQPSAYISEDRDPAEQAAHSTAALQAPQPSRVTSLPEKGSLMPKVTLMLSCRAQSTMKFNNAKQSVPAHHLSLISQATACICPGLKFMGYWMQWPAMEESDTHLSTKSVDVPDLRFKMFASLLACLHLHSVSMSVCMSQDQILSYVLFSPKN